MLEKRSKGAGRIIWYLSLIARFLPSEGRRNPNPSPRSMARDHWATGRFIDLIADIIYMWEPAAGQPLQRPLTAGHAIKRGVVFSL